MLNPEAAKQRLEAFKVNDPLGRYYARVSELPTELRIVGYGLLGYDAFGKQLEGWELQRKAKETAFLRLEAQSVSERTQIFTALFPELGEVMGNTWTLLECLPYQTQHYRKAFRAPDVVEAHHAAREQWLNWMLHYFGAYEQNVVWFAQWAAYLMQYRALDTLGILFAAAIDAGGPQGEEVLQILLDSARGEHEIGAMGRHVTRALLVASRPEGWEFIEKFLLAAQRQEGLRQVIFETVDEAHPEAFRRMLQLILDHDLLRFSSAMRAVAVWFGINDFDLSPAQWKARLRRVVMFLEDPDVRRDALCGTQPDDVFLALWCIATQDALEAVREGVAVLQNHAGTMQEKDSVAVRKAVVSLLVLIGLPQSKRALLPLLDDEQIDVAMGAFGAYQYGNNEALHDTDLFERLERLIHRAPADRKDRIALCMKLVLGSRSPKRLLPYLSEMETYTRASVVKTLEAMRESDADVRATLFVLVGDAASVVREAALRAIKTTKPTEPEIAGLEKLLTRKANDLRRGVLTVLLNQEDTGALGSGERLLKSGKAEQRVAGLELLQQMATQKRGVEACREYALAYQSARPKRQESEDRMLDDILGVEVEKPTLDNALGLLDNAQRTKPAKPVSRNVQLTTEAAENCLKSLEKRIEANRETPVQMKNWNGDTTEQLLGSITYGFPAPQPNVSLEEDLQRLPLRELWETWWQERSEAPQGVTTWKFVQTAQKLLGNHTVPLRDPDGLELLRALIWMGGGAGQTYASKATYARVIHEVFWWLLRMHPPVGAVDFLLDAGETAFAKVTPEQLARSVEHQQGHAGWRNRGEYVMWLDVARTHKKYFPEQWSDAHLVRLYGLLRWLDEPCEGLPRYRPNLDDLIAAYRAGGANDADVIDQLLGLRSSLNHYGRFDDLANVTRRKNAGILDGLPQLQTLVKTCRDRIIAVELQRGELPTAASKPACELRSAGGVATLANLLGALGNVAFIRSGSSYYYRDSSLSRSHVFSHLIRATFPEPEDTPQSFAAAMAAKQIPAQRLVELAVFAPQWAGFVGYALDWPEFAEGVWWLHAHTKDTGWSVDAELRELWEAQASERTPLSGQSLLDGAVDVAWFHRVYDALGAERWTCLDEAAKYASGGNGHKRAQLFADAMLGRVTKEELLNRIKDKRNQDALRALGLLPLPDDETRDDDVLIRYQTMQEFLRTSKQFGSMRQASEKLAANIGMENLARTAGFPDPLRLEWAMEARAIADLAEGSVTVQSGDVAVTLAINALGEPDIVVTKQGKALKSVPPAVKQEPAVAALLERKRGVQRQASRMRKSLEQAMCRGDKFTGGELQKLFAHPVLAPMLRSLVFVGHGIAGYPVRGGRGLETLDGEVTLERDTALWLAHPVDLRNTGAWAQWQKDCFLRERVQPFKQVFRELYVLTESETTDGTLSQRYAGHQVNPRQALALLGGRGWVALPEEGVRRAFHDLGIVAHLEFGEYFSTPAEVEGLTIESVRFTKRGEWKPLPLEEIPPRVFSEVMRDVDLVVSVAHQGGVDPESSASTVEMRSAIIRETCGLLKIENVRLQGSHALIDGKLGTYSVHLGSAVVHRQPGGYLCIVPVHSQHRGRLFLPFVDDDPRTAEALSKVLLLAKDTEIKDPSILEQILGRNY